MFEENRTRGENLVAGGENCFAGCENLVAGGAIRVAGGENLVAGGGNRLAGGESPCPSKLESALQDYSRPAAGIPFLQMLDNTLRSKDTQRRSVMKSYSG